MMRRTGIIAIAAILLVTACAGAFADPTPSYSVGFETEHKLLLDFARSAQLRAESVGRDFDQVSALADDFRKQENARQEEHEATVKKIEQARTQRAKAALRKARQEKVIADQQVADLAKNVAKLKRNHADIQANRAVKAAQRAAVSKARHAALTGKSIASPAATKIQRKAAARVAVKARKQQRRQAKKQQQQQQQQQQLAKAPVASAPANAKSLLQTHVGVGAGASLLSVESPELKIPEWPSLNDPANVAADTLIRARGAPQVYKQQDATLEDNLKKYPKHSGRESYVEHFQEWPQEQPAPKADNAAIQEFKKQKFLRQPAVVPQPAPASTTKVVVPATPEVQTAPKQAVTTSRTTVPPPAAVETKKFPWWILAIILGTFGLCLCGALLYLALRKKTNQDVEVNGYHQV